MRNLISFSCYRATLSFFLATMKVSSRRASKLFIDLLIVSSSQKSECLVPRSNWTVQRHFCPDCILACCCFSNAWCSEGIQYSPVALESRIVKQIWLSASVSAGSPSSELAVPGASSQTSRKHWPASFIISGIAGGSCFKISKEGFLKFSMEMN